MRHLGQDPHRVQPLAAFVQSLTAAGFVMMSAAPNHWLFRSRAPRPYHLAATFVSADCCIVRHGFLICPAMFHFGHELPCAQPLAALLQAHATMKGCIIPRMYSLTMAVLLPSADRCWVLDGVGCVSFQPRGPAPKTIGSASRCYTAALHAMVSRSTRPCVISAKIPTACNHWLPLCNH